MRKRIWIILTVVALLLVAAVPAFADAPNFGPAIYADGQAWGTKGLSELPGPNGRNNQSFDGLYMFGEDAVEGQLAVAEAAPGNPQYNGGRWIAYAVEWIGTPELVTSYDQLSELEEAGLVEITSLNNYFECPLLPVKN